MRREQHRHLHAGTATTNSSSLAAADCFRSSSSARSSAQQAAAAWAWFEHGGLSSCITPSKAEGLQQLVAANGCAKLYNSVRCAGLSRFKREVLSSGKIPQQGFADDHHIVITKPGGASRRFHPVDHHHDLADQTSDTYNQRFSSSSRSTSPCFHFDDGTVDGQDVAKNEESRKNTSCQLDKARCSLLDKFEVEAVCKQLHDHHDHSQELLKPRRYIKSCSTAVHKPSADTDHHHNINDMVRRLLHLQIRMSSGRSTSAAPPAPFFCSSIATANSIVDHHQHHRCSPKHSRSETPINRTANLQDKVSAAALDEHERGDFALGQRKSQQKLDVPHRDHELVEEGAPATQSSMHPSDSLLSHLPRLSAALALGHHKHADKSSRHDGVLALAHSNRHRQLHSDHVHHIHHHHHHYYHHPQQTNEASAQDSRRLLQDYYLDGHADAPELQAPKLYRFHKEKLVISGAADHGDGHP